MITQVVVDRKVVDGFRRRAIAKYPNEWMESVWGHVDGNTAFVHILLEADIHDAGPDSIDYDGEREKPDELEGAIWLGTIHSHPGFVDASPSEGDWDAGYKEGELLSIICSIKKDVRGRLRSRVRFWQPQKPIRVRYTAQAREKTSNEQNLVHT